MSAKGVVPMEVLSQALVEKIGGRRVRSAIFTTFTFDPGFFELNVLPLLFDQSFTQADAVRRVQLEDAIRGLDHLAVYYDRTALLQEAEPAQLDYRRIDVRRATGVFHPKVILLLVEARPDDEVEDDDQEVRGRSLIVVVSSANLTRAGWWDNIECAHIEEIADDDAYGATWRPDLLSLIRRIRDCAGPDENHGALDVVHAFLLRETAKDTVSRASAGGYFYTRLFSGQNQQSLTTWLEDIRLYKRNWNLEVISPYFDGSGAGPLEKLIDLVGPRETRVWLPREPDGTAAVTKSAFDAIAALEDVHWAVLPGEIANRGRDKAGEKLPPRGVHAKVYRFWAKGEGDVLIVGSPNLTSSAHSHGGAGNLEAAFFVDVSDEEWPRRWWLEPIDQAPNRFAEEAPTEADGLQPTPIDLSLRFDWRTGLLEYRLSGRREGFSLSEIAGTELCRIENPKTDEWARCPANDRMRIIFLSTSFLLVTHSQGSWRVLVREENMGYRPSLARQLTPEEILQYWSLLTADQRAEFLEEHLGADAVIEGLPVMPRELLRSRDTLFDRFAGIYHAFGCLRRSIEASIDEGRVREAEGRLFGAKYDSLPCLLTRTVERRNDDPITRYVTFLCARQLRDDLKRAHPELFRSQGTGADSLNALVERLAEVRAAIPLGPGEDAAAFLDWYEPIFLKWLGAGEAAA